MKDNMDPEQGASIPLLPRALAVAVQLVGTFGLAVFLVLYYVLVMQPQANVRYEALRNSIEALIQRVEEGQTLLTREQVERLEELYILAMAPELADRIALLLPNGPVPAATVNRLQPELEANLENLLIARTRFFRGLAERDGGLVSAELRDKIRTGGLPEALARRIILEWPYGSHDDVVTECAEALYLALRQSAPEK